MKVQKVPAKYVEALKATSRVEACLSTQIKRRSVGRKLVVAGMQPPRQPFERQNDQCSRNMRERAVDPALHPAQVAEVMMCDFVRQDKRPRIIGSAALDKPTRNVYIRSRQSEGSRRGKPQYFGDHRRQGRPYLVQR